MNYNPQNYYGTGVRNQYYGGYQPTIYDPNILQNIQQPSTMQPQQVTNSILNYDFVGSFVRTYDEVKNYPLNCDKPILLLDLTNEKLYIKQMDQKGNPIISAFNVAELKEENVSNSVVQTDNGWKKEMDELKKKIQEIENQLINPTNTNNRQQYNKK